MKTTFTIAAIAMFAVVLGMGALSPALAAPNNEKSSATTAVCHYFEEYILDAEGNPVLDETTGEPIVDEDASSWDVLYVSSKGAANGHTKHGDLTITTEAEALACIDNQDGTIETIEPPVEPPVEP